MVVAGSVPPMPALSRPVIVKPFAAPDLVPVNCSAPVVSEVFTRYALMPSPAELIALAIPAADWSALMSTATGVPGVKVPSSAYAPGVTVIEVLAVIGSPTVSMIPSPLVSTDEVVVLTFSVVVCLLASCLTSKVRLPELLVRSPLAVAVTDDELDVGLIAAPAAELTEVVGSRLERRQLGVDGLV